ncbi:type IV pili methyl-accepting chemotaxis transducer N-terminal domain-containing protein [Maribacter hydrothermalis]|uniref:type IV pili methyl-accepting chemotaxis transducer N-terminal domain-containing protein n=1 Tax=Maribacter hydrothermalis TaxID=1836467 RepID=UPI0018D39159|nr:type IV pili methyl-accepting chemotaxis transducer N-terminal domain-containing protein [Maribacter hydrothermalis]
MAKQRHDALRINIAGRQRMLSQIIVKDLYECKYATCDYGKLRVVLNKLKNTNESLQKGNVAIGLDPLDDESIQANFNKLQPYLNSILTSLNDFNKLNSVSIATISAEADAFLKIMETIVNQFQKSSEKDIKTLMIVELELAVFSLMILILEIFFFINPSIKKIAIQNKKLKEISWHQSHAFNSHITNIKKYRHILGIEKNLEHKKELVDVIMKELKDLEIVSDNMVKSLEKEQ